MPDPELSPREVEALQYRASGLNVKEIALAMGIKARTVRYHFFMAKCKLGQSDIIAAIVVAVQNNLIVPPVTIDKMTK